MKDIIVAKRYALSAIYNIKTEDFSEFVNEVKILSGIFESNPDLYQIMKSKIVTTTAKLEFLEEITSNFLLKDFWHSFFLLLTSKKRELIFIQILREILKQAYLTNDAKAVDIILAFEHTEETLMQIVKKIEHAIRHKIVYQVLIDKSIIGGFIAKAEDFIIDASVIGNLKQFVKNSITVKV
ncbi:MAG: ATP synthase F1 subunit delta [Candidatus Cloacimonetes bacterium]|nr:ATP synthase F1 subunit delta [Candidatus Cloacimonadota bacterium]